MENKKNILLKTLEYFLTLFMSYNMELLLGQQN